MMPLMIIRQDFSWWQAVGTVRGSTLQRTWPRLLLTIVIAVVVTVAHERYGLLHTNLTTIPFSLIGLALSIFLGFRNNTSYDRFWEGRKLWGALVNTTRSLTRQTLTLVGRDGTSEGDAADMTAAGTTAAETTASGSAAPIHRMQVHRIAAYAHLLRLHLRDERDHSSIAHLLPADEVAWLEQEHNRPIALLHRMAETYRAAWDAGQVHDLHLPVLEGSLTRLADIQGGCERIKATPIPFSYTVLIHRIVGIYCVGLPFGLVTSIGVLTPVVVALVAYAFYGLDAVGDEIENPFGYDNNDLPLSTLSRMIEVDVRKRLGEPDLPPLLTPQDGLLQ